MILIKYIFLSLVHFSYLSANFLSITDKFTGCETDFIQLNTSTLIWPFPNYLAPWQEYPSCKVYHSGCFNRAYEDLSLQLLNSNANKTLGYIINSFRNSQCPLYLKGGMLRDIIEGIIPHDVDCDYSCNQEEFKILCETIVDIENCYVPPTGYFFIGKKGLDSGIEGRAWNGTPFELQKYDYTPNTLFYDTINRAIIDLTGIGVNDVIKRNIHIPQEKDKWEGWLIKEGDEYARHSGIKVACRYWKLRLMGYNDNHEILEFLKEKVDKLWYNETYPMNKMFNFYICRDILGGNFNVTNSKCRLPNKIEKETANKCKDYLKIWKKDLGTLKNGSIYKDIKQFTYKTPCYWNENKELSGFIVVHQTIIQIILFLLIIY